MENHSLHEALRGLKPASLWSFFDQIRQIPRESRHEERIIEFLLDFAKKHDLEAAQDEAGNVIIKKAASRGHENASTVTLQAHVDMVCEKNSGVDFDFSTDPIELVRDGDLVKAKNTSLGADNGIGLAAGLAVLAADDLEHGPLELLCTVDEETGLNGANALTADMIKGEYLLNMDSEDQDTITIGCAGGKDMTLHMPVERIACEKSGFELNLRGFLGGHSGVDINKGRANAIKVLADILTDIVSLGDLYIAELRGGSKRNAIPRESRIVFATDLNEDTLRGTIEKRIDRVKEQYGEIEPQLSFTFEANANVKETLTREKSSTVINVMSALPHGVLAINPAVPTSIDTSTNLGVVELKEDGCYFQEMSRSSSAEAMNSTERSIIAIGNLVGATNRENAYFPPWPPCLDSALTKICVEQYERLFGKPPKIEIIHAGLEPSVIGTIKTDMEMISIGMDIAFPHSPDESVEVHSVERFWKHLIAILEALATLDCKK